MILDRANSGWQKRATLALCLLFFSGAPLAQSDVDLADLPLEQLMLREAVPVAQMACSMFTALDLEDLAYACAFI